MTKELVALKGVPLENSDEGFPASSIREIMHLRTYHHENVLALKYILLVNKGDLTWSTASNPELYLAFEYMPHDLSGIIAEPTLTLNEAMIKGYMQQLLRAIAHVHSFGAIHCDVKSSNVLVKHDGSLKLADFGLSRFKNPIEPRYNNNVVTRWYRSPELILGEESYTEAIDVWAVGCILAEFMARRPLFPGSDERDMAQQIFTLLGTPTEETWPGVEKMKFYNSYLPATMHNTQSMLRQHFSTFSGFVVLDLLEALLTVNPKRRITAQEALRHPWFTETPKPDKSSVRLPIESRNEAWIKKQHARQQQQAQQQAQQQRRQPISHPSRKRTLSPTNTYDSTTTQPSRKNLRTSTSNNSGGRYKSMEDNVTYSGYPKLRKEQYK